ncbi:hypothetical protein BUALT_Bualt06G0047800 [Buddleja alternifolia]|uniref:Poly(A) RNA polymerase mitochondrial-like central palm domain-containing protein n=1 Tax=Buddleja alternifolia TaxID=168488 RepID=A0AAV6XE94_9LAMI|nr:hypothetical protein BUALT_Bualt06G0047800 [Buddleja alternifolia]
MNGYNMLELTFRDILRSINPLNDDWSIRFHIITEIRAIVESIESLRGATVEPFGSFASNLFTRWGDLDISIEVQNGSYISCPGKKHKQSLLGDVLRALRKKGSFRRLQFISNARVPILKLESNYNISIDISINNLSGQMKSKILFWINEIDGRFRDMVKEWAKAHHINDSKSGTLNSYSLSLLVVFHLQTLVPAILPPLKDIYPGNMMDDLTGVRAVAEKHIEDTCAVNINRIKSNKSRLINRSSLSVLFISFLAKVEDPFEQPANTARSVSSYQLRRISEAIQATYGLLASANQNQASLVSVLVGPHVSRIMTRTYMPPPIINQLTSRTPVSNHSRNGHKTAGPERKPTSVHSQQQSQKKRTDKHPNGTTKVPVNASTSHKQQVWRPRSEVD